MTEKIDEKLAKDIGDIVQKLSLGTQLFITYPAGHPHPLKIFDQVSGMINNWVKKNGELVLVVFESKMIANNIKFDPEKNPILGSYIKRLMKRGIESVSFRYGLTSSHLQFLATTIGKNEKKTAADLLKEKGINEIGINQVQFGIIGQGGAKTRGLTTLDYTKYLTPDEETEDQTGKDPVQEQVIAAFKSLAQSMMSLYGKDKWDEMTKKMAQMAIGLNPSLRERILDEQELGPELVNAINEALVKGGGEKQKDDEIVKAFESMTSVLFRVKGGKDWQNYAKQITQIAAGLEPNVYKRVMQDYENDSSMGTIFRTAIKNMSDEQLIELVVSRYRDVKEIHTNDEDKVKILNNFMSSVEEADNNRIAKLSKIIEGRLKEENMTDDIGVRILEQVGKDNRVVLLKESTFNRLQTQNQDTSEQDELFEKMILSIDRKMDDESLKTRLNVIRFILARMDAYFEKFLSLELAQLLAKHLKTEKNANILKGLVSCLSKEATLAKSRGQKEVLLLIKRELEYQLKPFSIIPAGAKRKILETLAEVWGIESLESFIEAFGHEDLKTEVKEVLITLGMPAIPRLIEYLTEEPDPSRAYILSQVLLSFGTELTGPLARVLPQAGTTAKIRILKLLGQVGTEEEFTLLLPTLEDKNEQLRQTALEAIAALPGPREKIEDTLLKIATTDPILGIRVIAIELLSGWGGDQTVYVLSPFLSTKQKLVGKMKEELMSDQDMSTMKKTIIKTFGKMQNKEALVYFEAILNEWRIFNRQPLIETKIAVLEALANYKLDQVRGLLNLAVNRGENEVKAKAQRLLDHWQNQ
ncbi:MAG: HEAT repeat domain-containing protein [Candidatus Coatesbacteria bacterium]|nr:HEAT repeat domain-containing protein [Candidatus Coatesbacteria bacterium]